MSVAEVVMLGILAGFSVYDVKTKRVPLWAVAVLGGIVSGYEVFTKSGILSMITGLLPGALLLLLAYVTKESIGYGDGLVLCIVGMFCGLRETVAILGTALALAAVAAVILVAIKKAGRKTELPFLPFLCLGYGVSLLW